jgi:hypothetical protein
MAKEPHTKLWQKAQESKTDASDVEDRRRTLPEFVFRSGKAERRGRVRSRRMRRR